MYGAAQIMSVTGQKSIQSLTTYQRVDTEEKIKMGQTIPENVCPVSQLSALPLTARFTLSAHLVLQSIPPGSLVQDLVPVPPRSTHNPPALPSVAEHLDSINLDELLNDFTGTVQNKSTAKRSMPSLHEFLCGGCII